MTRFYFHVHDGTHAFLDDGGPDLPDEAAALAEARQVAWTLIYDLQHEVTDWSAWAVEVTDETGRSLSTLLFNDLLVPKGKPESQGWCGSLRCVALPATRPESSAATTGTADEQGGNPPEAVPLLGAFNLDYAEVSDAAS